MKTIIKILCLLCLPSLLLAANKPDLFLLKTYDDKKSVVGWMMSEKFDGIRGFWNGKQLLTRGGQQIIAPDWFVDHLELTTACHSKNLEYHQTSHSSSNPQQTFYRHRF